MSLCLFVAYLIIHVVEKGITCRWRGVIFSVDCKKYRWLTTGSREHHFAWLWVRIWDVGVDLCCAFSTRDVLCLFYECRRAYVLSGSHFLRQVLQRLLAAILLIPRRGRAVITPGSQVAK